MKKFIMVVIVLYSFLGVNIVFANGDTWTQKADFGGIARLGAVGFSIGSKGYIGMGGPDLYISNSMVLFKDFWEYDPAADTWTQKADFGGTARLLPAGFSIGNKGYVGTGWANSGRTKDFWEYDSAANIWTQKSDFGGTARLGAVGFTIGSKAYMGTGWIWPLGSMTKDFWEYDPATNTWTQKADFGGTGRTYAVGFAINSNGYIGMGAALDNNYQVIDFQDFWEYDPAADTWTQKSDFGKKQTAAVGFSIGSKGYIGTGIDDPNINSTIKDFWEYNPAIDAWTQKADFGGTARTLAIGFSIGNKGYLGTGVIDFNSISITKDFWEYTPSVASIISLNPVADKTSLWPPNNKMVAVTIQANASDSAGGPVTLSAQVSCNETSKRDQDWTQPVIDQGTGIISLSLRATRSGNGTGRIYTITVTATGTEGNSTTETVSIVVPHDQGK